MSAQALIQATALHRYYGKYHAVNDFNLTLHKGEVLGLLGPNGAGKSTTMQMLTGNIAPSSGDIVINGINLLDEPLKAKANIGYLPEQPPVYRDMTAVEYLDYCSALHSIPKSQQKKARENVIARCGLGDIQNKLIANLSKGFQQRVGIAQAIIHQPDLVILDEPTVGLDPIQIRQIRALIRELGKDHSVILSTHILPEVQAVCDRVQIIHQGKTVFADSFKQLENRQAQSTLTVGFSAGFSKGGDKAKLSSLQGVEKATTLNAEQSRFQLTYSPQNQPNPSKVFKLAVDEGWVLNELKTDTQTLEQIFMSLIHGDASAVEPREKVLKTGGVGIDS